MFSILAAIFFALECTASIVPLGRIKYLDPYVVAEVTDSGTRHGVRVYTYQTGEYISFIYSTAHNGFYTLDVDKLCAKSSRECKGSVWSGVFGKLDVLLVL